MNLLGIAIVLPNLRAGTLITTDIDKVVPIVLLYIQRLLLATGTIEGGLSAGTTAYTIPKIDEYLTNQGFDKETRDITLLALSATLGVSIGDSTASTANNVGQTEWNYLSHRELSAWKTSLIKCAGNQQCIDNVNAKYDNLNKTNFNHFKNYCTINFDAQRCHNRIRRFEDGTQGNYNLQHMSGLYTDISRLGGKDANKTITSVKFNNAFGGHTVRDTGIANINRDNGNEFQALVGELANERLYGGGRGGTVAGSGGYRVGISGGSKQRGEKGVTFRGGSQSQRDNWYGYNDPNFKKWWHREGKKDFGGKDIDNRQEAKDAYEAWVELGKPNVK